LNRNVPNWQGEAALLYQWACPAIPEEVGAISATEDNPGVSVVIHE